MLPIASPYLFATPCLAAAVTTLPLEQSATLTSTVVLPTQYLMPSTYYGCDVNREFEKEILIEKMIDKRVSNELKIHECCGDCKNQSQSSCNCERNPHANVSVNETFAALTKKLESMRKDIKSTLSSTNQRSSWMKDKSTQNTEYIYQLREILLPVETSKAKDDKPTLRPKSSEPDLQTVSSTAKPIWMPTCNNYYTRSSLVRSSTSLKTAEEKITAHLIKDIPVLATNNVSTRLVSFSDNTTFNDFNCVMGYGNVVYEPSTYNIKNSSVPNTFIINGHL